MQFYLQKKTRGYSAAAISLIVCLAALTACDFVSMPKESRQSATASQTKSSNKTDENSSEAKKTSAEKNVDGTKADGLVEVYDGRRENGDAREKKADDKDQNFVGEEVKKYEKEIIEKAKTDCDEKPAPFVLDIAEGAFTKPDSSQKVYLYELCRSGRAFGIGGFIFAENGKAVSHYIYGENGLEQGIFSLPDINKDGISEIVLVGGGTGQGYTRSAIDVYEINSGKLDYFGQAETFSSNDGAVENDSDILTTAHKISAQPASQPVFYRDIYEKRGSTKDWKETKKSEKFDLDKSEPSKIIKLY